MKIREVLKLNQQKFAGNGSDLLQYLLAQIGPSHPNPERADSVGATTAAAPSKLQDRNSSLESTSSRSGQRPDGRWISLRIKSRNSPTTRIATRMIRACAPRHS
jgi:hypothetical protein